MSFLKKDESKEVLEKLESKLYEDVYNKVAKKLIAEIHKNQSEINIELQKRLDNWDIMLNDAVIKKVKEEWDLIKKTKP